jgi:hypothetical protein
MIVSVRQPWTWLPSIREALSFRKQEQAPTDSEESSRKRLTVLGQFESMMAYQAAIVIRSWDDV